MAATGDVGVHHAELIALADLRPHPQNYREHPDDQREHIVRSLREHGFYRNVIACRDGTILAGHGIVEAAVEVGLSRVPVVLLDLEPESTKALKILTGDNEIARLAIIDDRMLAELLKEIRESDIDGLLGTGFEDEMLANLVYVTRPESEIGDKDDAAAWVGLPDFAGEPLPPRLVIQFDSPEDRLRLLELIGIPKIHNRLRDVWSTWWPYRPREDLSSLRFDDDDDGEEGQ